MTDFSYVDNCIDLLNIIYIDHIRLSPKISKKANAVITSFNNYKLRKAADPLYDPLDEVLTKIKAKAQKVNDSAMRFKDAEKVKFFERVKVLSKNQVPSWSDIDEIHVLCIGRGFYNSQISRIINAKPNDNKAKINCVNTLLNFVKTIK